MRRPRPDDAGPGGLLWLGAGHDGLIAATFEMALAPTDAAPALARAELTAWLGRQLDGGALVDSARLLVSEIVTNSIRHAQVTTAQPLRLIVSLDASTLRLELRDTGTDGTVARRTPSRDDGAGGFGLDLVARMSSAWGVERDGDGTTVWIELPAMPDATD